jgi:hypothetical protein
MNTQQLLKDYTSIVIARQAALKATQGLIESHELKLSMKQYVRVFDRFYQFIESGDRSWIDNMDVFLKLEDNKNFEDLVK